MGDPSMRSELQFVRVKGGKKGGLDKNERQILRAHVMRNYLRKKNNSDSEVASAVINERISLYLNKFRANPYKPRRRSSPSENAAPSNNEPEKPFQTLLPAGSQAKFLGEILNIPRMRGLYPFASTSLDVNDTATRHLLDFYVHSYWSNSDAVNPEGLWMSIALSEPVILHATLSLVALHWQKMTNNRDTYVYYLHRGEAMRLLFRRLADHTLATSDETIGAIAILSSLDDHCDWTSRASNSHIEGLAALIELRGGIKTLSKNRHVNRIVGWADLLHAATHETGLHLQISPYVKEASSVEITDVLGEVRAFSTGSFPWIQHVPYAISDIIRQLQILRDIKSAISIHRTKSVRRLLSRMLWKAEHDVIALENEPQAQHYTAMHFRGIFQHHEFYMAMRAASFIFTYSVLRDQILPVLFTRLTRRLRIHLEKLFIAMTISGSTVSPSMKQQKWYDCQLETSDLSLLLWIAYSGWKGAQLGNEDPDWFSNLATLLCSTNPLIAAEDVRKSLSSVVLLESHPAEMLQEFCQSIQ